MQVNNKRGQDLSIGTLILIVLGIVVLVLLILGFSIGWQDLFAKINIFSGGSNLESVVTACNLAVTSKSTISFCEFKKVKVSGATEYVNCEDSRISRSLEGGALNCETNAVTAHCGRLITALSGEAGKKDCSRITTPVNGQKCSATGVATSACSPDKPLPA